MNRLKELDAARISARLRVNASTRKYNQPRNLERILDAMDASIKAEAEYENELQRYVEEWS